MDTLTKQEYDIERAVFDRNVADDDFVASWIKLAKHHLATKIGIGMRKSLESELSQATNNPTAFKAKWDTSFKTLLEVINGG